jgi:fructokinase
MIVVCGENLIDLVPRTCGDESGFVARAGGSPYNVVVGLGRLRVPCAYLGRVSRDRFGRSIRERLESNGVDTRFVREGDELTTLAVVHLDPGHEPEFAFYGDGTADRLLRVEDLPAGFPDGTVALHFGSISLLREPGASTLESLMRRERGRRVLSLDPNVRPGLIPDRGAYVARLEGWVALMDLVKVSRADLAWLYPDRLVEGSARDWLARGPELVVVTQGEAGASAITRAVAASLPGLAVSVADTVGAGDAFMTGLLGWLHDHGRLERAALARLTADELNDCLRFANTVAGLACTRTGAEPPPREEVAGALAGSPGS